MGAPGNARGQSAGGKWRIGVLFTSPRPATGRGQLWEQFVEGLRELGYVEGQNVVFESAYTEGDAERRAREAARVVATRPDIIVAAVGVDALALRNVTATIPIVVASGADLVAMGLVASLARPGGNVTGLQMSSPDLGGKRLEFLKIIAPKVKRVGVVHERREGIGIEAYRTQLLADLGAAGRALGIQVREINIEGPDGVDRVADRVREEGADALFIRGTPFTNRNRQRLLDLAIRYRLPVISDILA